MTEYCITNPA